MFSALGEGQGTQVVLSKLEEVVAAHEGGKSFANLRRHGLAVETLLQVGKGAGRVDGVADQQLAVERGGEVHGVDEIGEGARHVVAGARIEPADAALRNGLDADAV